jgi:subtilisin family serine protease
VPERYQHLKFARLVPITDRRGHGGGPRPPKREPATHAERLDTELDAAIAHTPPVAAFDPRLLLKLEIRGLDPIEIEHVQGFEIVSHEQATNTVVALFASDAALREFKRRLGVVKAGNKVTRADILYAIERVDVWSADDRRGPALSIEGLPNEAEVIVDVELWPLERANEREQLCTAFERWTADKAMTVLDKVKRSSLILYRIRVAAASVESELLQHRDVRLVDLPPRYRLETVLLEVDAQRLGAVPAPPDNAPGVVVLDSGIVTNHPLLGAAVGDAQSFLPDHDENDEHGHGTAVAGLALYHDVAACAENQAFVPELRIFSGRVLGADGRNATGLLENQISAAVDYFMEQYGARVFNLSVGDDRKPYRGGHVRGLAVTLDELARSKGILFIVPAGNYTADDQPPRWRAEYPRYLLDRDDARLLDPAPALNVLTVGGLARYEASRQAQRYADDPAQQCVARRDQPSPFTRTGPGPMRALKPELVEYAGNYAVDMRDGAETLKLNALLGEVSLSHAFAQGNLLVDRSGTSFAAPKIAHLAAKLLAEYPAASANLVRALLVASAEVPEAARQLGLEEEDLRRLVGYGRPSEAPSRYSTERRVTLIAEDGLGEDAHHFYEIPLPADFLERGRRERILTVALAHTPLVRTTRADYRGSKFGFHVVPGASLDEVTKVFKKTKKAEREDMIAEVRKPDVGPQARSRGTVQAARYGLRQLADSLRTGKLFVVVTRQIPSWARNMAEEEAYAIVVTLEDRSGNDVRLYTQVQQLIRQRARQRT